MKLNLLLFVLLVILSASSCSTTKVKNTPLWFYSVSKVYPDDKFIAQKGTGKDRASAESSALAALSKFFSSQIQTHAAAMSHATDAAFSSAIQVETFVSSQTELLGVRYSEPYFDSVIGECEIVAYINREEAWGMYEPRLHQKTEACRLLYMSGENKHEAISKIIVYMKVVSMAEKEELEQMLSFADVLYPQSSLFYVNIRSMLSAIPAKIEQLLNSAMIAIDCPVDFGSRLSNSVSATLEKKGFIISEIKEKSDYICSIILSENSTSLAAGTFFYPILNISISNGKKTLFSFNKTLDKIGAANPDVAKQRLYDSLAKEIQKSFWAELK